MNNIEIFETLAREKLPRDIYEYYAGGASDGISLIQNQQSFNQLNLIPRVLKNVSEISTKQTLFGVPRPSPIIIAPTSFQQMADPEGELSTAKAASQTSTTMIVSLMANIPLEDIAKVPDSDLWFQLYVLNDRDFTLELIKRAEEANYKSIVLTVDSQTLGIRNNSSNKNFTLPDKFKIANFNSNKKFAAQFNSINLFDKNLTWKDILWVKQNTKLPLILKGILHPEDAKIALENEIEGIVISNHGARQLDTAIPPLIILPQIVKITSNKIPILLDGGIRRGTDILKAIALGADGVLIGRPILWGLAANGTQGVISVLEILRKELEVAMALSGFKSIKELRENGSSIIFNRVIIKEY